MTTRSRSAAVRYPAAIINEPRGLAADHGLPGRSVIRYHRASMAHRLVQADEGTLSCGPGRGHLMGEGKNG